MCLTKTNAKSYCAGQTTNTSGNEPDKNEQKNKNVSYKNEQKWKCVGQQWTSVKTDVIKINKCLNRPDKNQQVLNWRHKN